MNERRKLPATAGAEWLTGAYLLLRRQPVALGLLGLGWGVLAMLGIVGSAIDPSIGLFLQLVVTLAGPVLFAGIVAAVHDVDRGRPVAPGALWQGFSSGHVPALLATLLPQLIAALLLALLLLALVGTEGLARISTVWVHLQEAALANQPPDEALVRELPAGRILFWLLLVVVAFAANVLALFLSVPQILFGGRGGIDALRDSLRAALHNLGAVLVFFVMTGLVFVAFAFVVNLFALAVQFVFGAKVALTLAQLLTTAVAMPLFAAAVYVAWKQVLGSGESAAPPRVPPPATHLEA